MFEACTLNNYLNLKRYWKPLCIIALLASLLTGCVTDNPNYCDNLRPCRDAEKPFCDTTGRYPASDGVNNVCIPDPFATMDASADGATDALRTDSDSSAEDSRILSDSAQPAMLVAQPDSLDFSEVTISSTSAAQTITVTNYGDRDTGEIAVSIEGSSRFQVPTNDCVNPLAGGNDCEFTVTFAPTSAGEITASVHVSSTPGGSSTVTVRGVGVE